MKQKNKAIIDTYETLYTVDIVVANRYVSLNALQKLYKYCDNVELDECICDGLCTTCTVTRKTDNKTCILIKENAETSVKSIDKKADRINTIAHEATHGALRIYEIIGQSVCMCGTEPLCWLTGYIAECIYKTLFKR